MSVLEGWNLERYREALRRRAETLRIDPRVQVGFDESDLVQETLTRALLAKESPCRGSADGERLAWLFTIQERLLLDRYDREYAGIRDVRRNAMQQALVDSTADFIVQSQAGGPSPSEDAAEREEQEIFAKLLEQLPPEHREPLLLRQEGLKVAEIAKRLGVTEGVVAGRIARATRRLAEMSKTLRADTEDG